MLPLQCKNRGRFCLIAMPPAPRYTQEPWRETFSEIIDVRSPSEFAEDHVPGAINLPVLNDEERAEVGTVYKQVSPFCARKIGAALVAKNISQHLRGHFATKGKDYSPLVYCWRGGQRSASMATVLSQIGWRITLLEGGYKTYRTYVRQQLAILPTQFTYKVLSGLTGSGKTYILQKMRQHGVQILDLEDIAKHRGSLLGQQWKGKPTPQPSQKFFESLLIEKLLTLDPREDVWIESESNKIGKIYLPPSLWGEMKKASCVEIQLPIKARVQFLLQEYPHFMDRPDLLKVKLEKLKNRHGWEKISQWYQMIDSGEWEKFVEDILFCHYDSTYKKSMQNKFSRVDKVLSMSDLSDSSIENLLDYLVPKYASMT